MTQQQKETKKLLKQIGDITGQRLMYVIFAYIAAGLMLLCSFLPYSWQVAEEYSLTIIWMLASLCTGWSYLTPYRIYNVGQNKQKILTTIKYLPVDFKDVRYVKLHSLCKIYGLLFPISMVLQFFGCVICEENFTWINILGVILHSLVFPLGFNTALVYMDKEV